MFDNSAKAWHAISRRRQFIGGSDVRIIMSGDEAALLRLWREKRCEADTAHRDFVCSQPCLICGLRPSDSHHIRFGQPRALGRKVSDEFTVPLCRVHHRDLHRRSAEKAWGEAANIAPIEIAERQWRETRRTA